LRKNRKWRLQMFYPTLKGFSIFLKCYCKGFFFSAFIILLFLSCASCIFSDLKPKFSLASYNVKSLFDDEDSFLEFEEFSIKNGKWSEALYQKRLNLLVEAILEINSKGPDILVLLEIENKRVLSDLLTKLKPYSYTDFVITEKKGSCLQNAVISRYKFHSIKIHDLVYDDTMLRPIIELEFAFQKDKAVLFACHFKSKSEGSENTEKYRVLATSFLNKRINELESKNKDIPIMIAGDLNENADEEKRIQNKYTCALTSFPNYTNKSLSLSGDKELVRYEAKRVWYSPYLNEEGYKQYSYYFNDTGATIDHILVNKACLNKSGLEYESFAVVNSKALSTSKGKPYPWNSKTQKGYSDHFPVIANFVLLDK